MRSRLSRLDGGARAPLLSRLLQYVARLSCIYQCRPVVRESRWDGRSALRTHRSGRRAGEQIALASRVVSGGPHRGHVTGVVGVALLERGPGIAGKTIGL